MNRTATGVRPNDMSNNTRCRLHRAGLKPNKIELNKFNDTISCHEFGGMSRVIVVRKTDQRIFQSAKNGEEPKYETITKETYVTYRGNKTERKFTSVEKRDVTNKLPVELKSSQTRLPAVHTPTRFENRKTADAATFQAECLEAHNQLRVKHGVPPLKLSRKMCQVSKEWADKLALRGKIEHSNNKEYGENIFGTWSSDPSYSIDGRLPVESWYAEIKDHVFGVEPSSMSTGHFTQVVWKESKELGVACTKAKNGNIYVVANYYPPGNYIGCYNENVPPLGGFKTSPVRDYESITSAVLRGATTSRGTNNEEEFELECLKAHNEYRAQHGAPPLKLNKKLCKDGREWAKVLAQKGKMEHKPNIPQGENIFSCWSSNPNHVITGKEAVDKWYEEISVHNFSSEPTDLRSGHFTQVIWKGSKELGVGLAKSKNGQIFVVARYAPPGNYVGNFKTNVLPKGTPINSSGSSEAIDVVIPENFPEEALKIHNEYRKKHGVPELKLNLGICEYAKAWAEQIAKDGKMTHRPDCKYGENIFMMWSSDPTSLPTARDVCKKWYDEINDYNFATETRGPLKSGHFTQMIWKESKEMGIAMVRGKNGKTFIVANYNPKGNFIGKFINNVPKPIK